MLFGNGFTYLSWVNLFYKFDFFLFSELNSYPCYEHEFTEALASVFRPQSLPDTDKSKEKSLVLQQNKGQAEIDYLEHRLGTVVRS